MPLLLMILWLILNGKVNAETLVSGLLVTTLIQVFLLRALGWSVRKDRLILRTLPIFLLYLLNLIREIVLAAGRVALLALNPSKKPEPVLVAFDSGLGRNGLNVLLANAITLTPGTITVSQDGDRFRVHALRPEYAEGLKDASFLRLLRRFPK